MKKVTWFAVGALTGISVMVIALVTSREVACHSSSSHLGHVSEVESLVAIDLVAVDYSAASGKKVYRVSCSKCRRDHLLVTQAFLYPGDRFDPYGLCVYDSRANLIEDGSIITYLYPDCPDDWIEKWGK